MPQQTHTSTMALEKRTIDHIPVTERHGRVRDLFTIWFGSNIMLLTVATGLLATQTVGYGLPVWAAILALVVGNAVGGVVMALHAGADEYLRDWLLDESGHLADVLQLAPRTSASWRSMVNLRHCGCSTT